MMKKSIERSQRVYIMTGNQGEMDNLGLNFLVLSLLHVGKTTP